jgi:hypothetical protein
VRRRRSILKPRKDSGFRSAACSSSTPSHVNLRTERDGQALGLVRYQGGEESVEDTATGWCCRE